MFAGGMVRILNSALLIPSGVIEDNVIAPISVSPNVDSSPILLLTHLQTTCARAGSETNWNDIFDADCRPLKPRLLQNFYEFYSETSSIGSFAQQKH